MFRNVCTRWPQTLPSRSRYRRRDTELTGQRHCIAFFYPVTGCQTATFDQVKKLAKRQRTFSQITLLPRILSHAQLPAASSIANHSQHVRTEELHRAGL